MIDPIQDAMNRLFDERNPHARETAERNYKWLCDTLKGPFNAEENYARLCEDIRRLKQEQQ